MNINQILVAMIGELGKLLLRSEGKTDTLANAGLKCLHLLSHSFADIEGLTQGLAEDKIHALFEHWYPEKEAPEPCYVPFSPNGKNKKNSTGYLIHIFKGEQDIMPSPLDQISIEAKPYHRILHSLKHDVKSIVGALSVDTWVHILHRYCKWIPASIALSHISLYHYTRLKMALAACLKPEEIQKILEKFQSGQKSQDSYLALLRVQFHGKEAILYNQIPQSDVSILKGQAYYWQMLKENCIEAFLKAGDLPIANELILEDDGFTILMRADHFENVQRTQLELEKFLANFFHGKVQMSIAWKPISVETLHTKDFTVALKTMNDELAKQEKCSFSALLRQCPEYHSALFGPYSTSPNADFQHSMRQLGETMSNARWLKIQSTHEPNVTNRIWEDLPLYFGKKLSFLAKKNDENIPDVYRFNNTDFAMPGGCGFVFSDAIPYLSIEAPEELKHWTIINIAIESSISEGEHSYLQYISQYEHVQEFLRGYVSALLREKKYRHYTYFVYVQSQQITLVCAPVIAFPLLTHLYKKIRSLGEDRFVLSGRMKILHNAFPLSQALFHEEQALHSNILERNKVVLDEEVLPWSAVESLLKIKSRLANMAKNKGKNLLFQLWNLLQQFPKTQSASSHWKYILTHQMQKLGITEHLERPLLEAEKGFIYLCLALRWYDFMNTLD